ncbi:MAG: hypothetical protein JNJ90_08930 [Saprospiraceae bacterium]|nr:hypothetical protein [Saprospiraceae bacterium]
MQHTHKQALAKNPLLIAGCFAMFFAAFLVWADQALANRLNHQNQAPERSTSAAPAKERPMSQTP